MSLTAAQADQQSGHERILRQIEQRVLWLATSIVHHANRLRSDPSGLKIGGHQASSASMVTIMTALWLEELRAGDRVAMLGIGSGINCLMLGVEWQRSPAQAREESTRPRRKAAL